MHLHLRSSRRRERRHVIAAQEISLPVCHGVSQSSWADVVWKVVIGEVGSFSQSLPNIAALCAFTDATPIPQEGEQGLSTADREL